MKPGITYIAQGTLRRKGRRTIPCSECGRQYTEDFDTTLHIDQRVTAHHPDDARYLVEDQHRIDLTDGVDRWLEPLTVEPLPVDQLLRELGAPELIKGPPGWGGLHLRL